LSLLLDVQIEGALRPASRARYMTLEMMTELSDDPLVSLPAVPA
jgi:hypothetical protein